MSVGNAHTVPWQLRSARRKLQRSTLLIVMLHNILQTGMGIRGIELGNINPTHTWDRLSNNFAQFCKDNDQCIAPIRYELGCEGVYSMVLV